MQNERAQRRLAGVLRIDGEIGGGLRAAVYGIAMAVAYFAAAYALGRKIQLWLKRQPGTAPKGQRLSVSIGLALLNAFAFAVALGLGALLLALAAMRRNG